MGEYRMNDYKISLIEDLKLIDDKIDNFDYSNNYSTELMNLAEKVLNMNNVYKVVTNNCYGGFSISDEACQWIKERDINKDFEYREDGDISEYYMCRHHPLLVECIETLGEDANGDCAKLVIEKIYGNLYIINSYDGLESIETPYSEKFWNDASKY